MFNGALGTILAPFAEPDGCIGTSCWGRSMAANWNIKRHVVGESYNASLCVVINSMIMGLCVLAFFLLEENKSESQKRMKKTTGGKNYEITYQKQSMRGSVDVFFSFAFMGKYLAAGTGLS